jgi:hypothetical protein
VRLLRYGLPDGLMKSLLSPNGGEAVTIPD